MNLYYYQLLLLLLITKYSCKQSPKLGAGGEEHALKYLRANVSSPCVGDLEMEAQPQNIFCVCTTFEDACVSLLWKKSCTSLTREKRQYILFI